MSHVYPVIEWDVFIPDEFEGVRSFHLLFLCSLVSFFGALTQATERVYIGDGQRVCVPWMTSHLAEF